MPSKNTTYKPVNTVPQTPGIGGCPHCGNYVKSEVFVTTSRVHKVGKNVTIRRRRCCFQCAGEWDTIEVPIRIGEAALLAGKIIGDGNDT